MELIRSKETYEVYAPVYNNLSQFLTRYYRRNDLFIKELEAISMKDFEQYLRVELKCSINGINCYMTDSNMLCPKPIYHDYYTLTLYPFI